MRYRTTQSVLTTWLLVLAVLIGLPAAGLGQTFRGGINGTVTDQSGAVVPGAQVTAVETATNSTYKAVTTSAGEFAFANLPLGDYAVTVVAPGFSSQRVNQVTVSAGMNYTLPVKLGVAMLMIASTLVFQPQFFETTMASCIRLLEGIFRSAH